MDPANPDINLPDPRYINIDGVVSRETHPSETETRAIPETTDDSVGRFTQRDSIGRYDRLEGFREYLPPLNFFKNLLYMKK